MNDRGPALFLISAKGKNSSFSVGVSGAAEAVRKAKELEAEGRSVTVLDTAGRELPISDLEASVRAAN